MSYLYNDDVDNVKCSLTTVVISECRLCQNDPNVLVIQFNAKSFELNSIELKLRKKKLLLLLYSLITLRFLQLTAQKNLSRSSSFPLHGSHIASPLSDDQSASVTSLVTSGRTSREDQVSHYLFCNK